ncbi:MAG: hypothetical protein ABW278_03020, partial [Steroidobacteraceae bacterium]
RVANYTTALGIEEPVQWAFDGDVHRKEPVLDPLNGNRVLRYAGYRKCLRCREVNWTEDVARVRLCDKCRVQRMD